MIPRPTETRVTLALAASLTAALILFSYWQGQQPDAMVRNCMETTGQTAAACKAWCSGATTPEWRLPGVDGC